MVSGTANHRVSIALLLAALSPACGSRAGQSSGDAGSGGPDAPIPVDAPLPLDAPPAPDAAVPPDASAPPAPRLIAPLSMTAVTQQRPTLRWTLPDGVTAPMVDLCRDRACTMPLPITVDMADGGRSAVPQTALPTGWVYWRVRATSGS